VIGQLSRYQWSSVDTDEAGRRYFGERPVFGFRDLPDNRLHVVKQGERLWHLGHMYFPGVPKNGALYWAIADFQPEPVLDATLDLNVGSIIVVPSIATLNAIFSSSRRQTS
jgi:hypothetical protein